jgi:isoquinoline 1-oxidoreductase subunit beta
MKRRTWILGGLGAAGALIVGWGALPMRSRLGTPEHMLAPVAGEVALNGWIKITQDGRVVLAMARAEMGQGVHTALPMLVAEELDVPLATVQLEQAGDDAIYGNVMMMRVALPFHPLDMEGDEKPLKIKVTHWLLDKAVRELGLNATGGSSSVSDAWDHLRMAAALARASLVNAAADAWKVPAAEITVVNGVIRHASGKQGHYGEFAKAALALKPTEARLKDRKDWKLIGTAAPRTDVPAKVNGSARFGLDVRPEGLVFAAIRQSPLMGGSLGSLDEKAAMAIPGVERFVKLPGYAGGASGFAVVGKTTWHALQGAAAAQAVWKQRPLGALDSQAIEAHLSQMASQKDGFSFYKKGDVVAAHSQATRVVEATYTAPFLAHATMEPMNCTAQVKEGRVTIWTGTQVPGVARAIAAKVAGVDVDKVTLHAMLLGGGFGRRLEVDYVAQAVRVAMDCGGRPVQLVWSREEDTTHDFYRPMLVAHLKASTDAPGAYSTLSIKSAGDALSPRFMERILPAVAGPVDPPDKATAEGLFDLPYGFAHQHMTHVATRTHVPIGNWRSVGHSHNAFISESFIDEIAFETKQDPLALRRALLKGAPRYLAVLNLAAEKAQWDKPAPAGRARGVALHESFGSIVAQVAEVSLLDDKPRVHRVVCAIDCGTVVNPGIVAQQMESSVVFALTAALYGRIDIVDGVVQQTNFNNYPMVKLLDAPVVDTHIMPSTRAPSGVGEPGVPPLAPAVANAVFVLTGKRHRTLPLVV